MRKNACILLAILLLLLGTAACSPQTTAQPAQEAESVETLAPQDGAETQEVDYTTGTPWLCVDLEGVVTEDTPADVKDNFALYVNKDKILATEIPEGYSSIGTIMSVVLQADEDIKNMFKDGAPANASHDAQLAHNFYGLLMDWDSRNAAGVAPLKALTDAVEAIDSLDALRAYILETPVEKQLDLLWGSGSTVDYRDSKRHILVVGDCGTLLGDSAEYAELTDYGRMKKEAYTELARKMLLKLGYPEEEALRKIENAFAFDALIAPAVYTSEESQQADIYARVQNYYSREELREAQGSLPILEFLEALGYPQEDEYMVENPEFLKRMNEVLTEENLPLIRDKFIVGGVITEAGSLDRECYEWANDCKNAISGASGILDDETKFSQSVSAVLDWAVARAYSETYLKAEDKDRITEMTREILDAYHGILQEADFLSDETKAKALEKLDAIKPRVLYPDSWEKYEYDGLDFASAEDGGSLCEAWERISAYQIAENVKEHSEPVDKELWDMTPQTVNAYYDPQGNSITIMGAFAQGDLYNSAMSDEEALAKLGSVIGHEISHAFDSSGAQFDKDGNMSDWWTEEDYAAFTARNEKLEAYYDAMHPWEGQDFYGSIMTGEACADMAGVKVALRVAAGKENFDYDAFFRAYANVWLTKDTLQRVYYCINDVHPLCYLRVNGTLQQFDEFLDFYGITEGDGMYLAPENRVCIW